jgi:hypothetical protein
VFECGRNIDWNKALHALAAAYSVNPPLHLPIVPTERSHPIGRNITDEKSRRTVANDDPESLIYPYKSWLDTKKKHTERVTYVESQKTFSDAGAPTKRS